MAEITMLNIAAEKPLDIVVSMALDGARVEDIITVYGQAMGWTAEATVEKTIKFRENLGEFALSEGIASNGNEVKLLNYMAHHTLKDSVIKLAVIDLCQTRVEFADVILAVSNGFADVLKALSGKNIVVEELTTSVSKPNSEVVINGSSKPVTSPSTVTAKKITMKNVTVSVDDINLKKAVLTAKASESDVNISGMVLKGAIAPKSTVQGIIEANGEVVIKDSVFAMSGYNNINIGDNSVPSKITIENCDFTAPMTNNAISIYQVANGGTVIVKNCIFHDCSNALRLFNENNASFKMIVEDCQFKKWEERNPQWAGALILEDAHSKSVEAEEENNRFAPEKIKIEFINCSGPHGKFEVSDVSKVCGTQDENQIVYVFYHVGKDIAYGDGSKYPEITFK